MKGNVALTDRKSSVSLAHGSFNALYVKYGSMYVSPLVKI